MNDRDFSDSIKLSIITDNMKRNNGNVSCEICNKKLLSKDECHFDHIIPYSKGGKSSLDNCQILCIDCNLKKSNKELQDFLLEKNALDFLSDEKSENHDIKSINQESSFMTKESFDDKISKYISLKGNIHKVDFSRAYNDLPSIHYVRRYYGDLNTLKKSFGIIDLSLEWDRKSIKESLQKYVKLNGDIAQKDLTKKNNLPSLPCILRYFPEYKNFTDIKKNMLNLSVRSTWDKDSIIKAGKDYVKKHGKITENDLHADNNLPSLNAIYRYFPSMIDYQKEIGSVISNSHKYITPEEIESEINKIFKNGERIIESKRHFFDLFPFSPSTIQKRYGTFLKFCEEYGITVMNKKISKYTKDEVDNKISNYIKNNKKIPLSHQLVINGLPSKEVICKYYENWREPFVLFSKLYEKIK